MRCLITLFMILSLGGWSAVSAQSLAELAQKEKDRRQKVNATNVRSFDDTNLRSRGILPVSGSSSSGPSEDQESGRAIETADEGEQEPEEDPTRTEAYWRNRLAPIDQRIADTRARLEAPGFTSDPDNFLRRQRLERDLKRALADRQTVLEEARRKRVPPGWLR